MTIRLIALVDINAVDVKEAYAKFYKGMGRSKLDWESSDEWYNHEGQRGDVEWLSNARKEFLAIQTQDFEEQTESKTKEELISFIEKNDLGELLDEDVHDVKSNEATDINNEGPTAQVNCLLAAGYDLDTIQSKVTDDEDEDVESQEPYDRVGAEPEPESD